jgi:MFS family permease
MLYARRPATRAATLHAFAWTCAIESLLIAVPYALGDRVALLALMLRSTGVLGLAGHEVAWTIVTSAVVLPAAVVAGYQFPLLIALLGEGTTRLGRHVGLAYACNTGGAIAGSLLGGFLLLPGLGALGAWRLSVLLLLGLAATALVLGAAGSPRARGVRSWLGPVVVAGTCLAALFGSVGPTALWRHSPIGTGRSDSMLRDATPNTLRSAILERRRAVRWEAEGRESSIGLYTLNDTSFLVNGKSDGAAVLDGGTQVMGGLLGALLHPRPVRRALVIGLGTGSTAGWLGRLPEVERVDVVELEPAMVAVARICAPVNAGVLDNPRVHLHIGDAREVLLTTPRRYDLIFSEPSNPYRAGIASLFTREFYQAVAQRLTPEGVFVQWVQAYEIDGRSVRTVYATLSAVFSSVESWRTKDSDLMLIARGADRPVHLRELADRIGEEPFRSALMAVWRTHRVEGVLARFVARPSLARALAEAAGPAGVNTDDRNLLEFAIARALGRADDFQVAELLDAAADRGEREPVVVGDDQGPGVDWSAVQDEMMAAGLVQGAHPWVPRHPSLDDEQNRRLDALRAWVADHPKGVIEHWEAQGRAPQNAVELMVVADAYAVEARDEAAALIEQLRRWQPVEADAITARYRWAKRQWAQVLPPLRRMIEGYRTDPWASNELVSRTLALGPALAERDESLAVPIYELLGPTFNVDSLTYLRRAYRLDVALDAGDGPRCVRALDEIGPHLPWYEAFLQKRVDCYRLAADPRLRRAEADLAAFAAAEAEDFVDLLDPGLGAQ